MLSLLSILTNGCGSGEDFGSGGNGTATGGSGSGSGSGGSAGEAVQEFGIRLGGAKLDELKGVEKISDSQLMIYGNTYSPNLDFNEDGSPDAIGQGNVDGFIASYDISGNFLWGYQLGGSGPDYIHGALKLKDGNILVYGEFRSSNFNADGDPQTHELTAAANSGNAFIATYDPEGNLKWIQRLSADDFEFDYGEVKTNYPIRKIEQLNNGSLLVLGNFSGKFINLNNDNTNEKEELYFETLKSYIANYDVNSGQLLWYQIQKSIGNVHNVDALGSYVFSNDDVLLYGWSEYGQTDLDMDGQVDLEQPNDFFYYLARYSKSGALLWKNSFRGSEWGLSRNILNNVRVTDKNIFVIGEFEGDFYAGNTKYAGQGNSGGFLASFDSANGNAKWAQIQDGSGDDVTKFLIPMSDGSVTIGGSYESPQLAYGGNSSLLFGGNTDVFVIQYDANGQPKWANRIAGPGYDAMLNLGMFSDGRIFAFGYFDSDNIDMNGDNVADINKVGKYSSDLFLVTYKTDGTVEWFNPIQSDDNDYNKHNASLIQTSDDRILIAGYSHSLLGINYDQDLEIDIKNNSLYDYSYIIGYDSHGAIASFALSDQFSLDYINFNLLENNQGVSWSKEGLIKTNADGSLHWQLTFKESLDITPKFVVGFPGALILTGDFQQKLTVPNIKPSVGEKDIFLAKYKW